MSFVAKHIVGPDERLIGVARLHWIYVVIGLFWAAVVLLVGAWIQQRGIYFLPMRIDQHFYWFDRDLGSRSAWMMAAFVMVACGMFLMFLLQYISTEVALTTKRVIRKSGLIAIDVHEIELEEIDAANIHHGWLGAILGYGAIHLDCRFVGDVRFPAIRYPYRFLRALHKAQGQHHNVPEGTVKKV